jgi:putative glycosyltransferase (TIGR04372 family)
LAGGRLLERARQRGPVWLVAKLAERVLGPLLARLPVRFIDVYLERIGELAVQADLAVKMERLGWRRPLRLYLLAPPERVCNAALLDYWRPYLRVVDSRRAARLLRWPAASPFLRYDPAYVRFPDGRVVQEDQAMVAVQAAWEREGRSPVLSLTSEHAEAGRARLRELGLADGDWFVALHVRDPGFLAEPETSHRAYRNADIGTYLEAVDEILARGGWVIRMGDPSMKPLPRRERLIDYALSDARADWLDVFLAASCRFLLGTTSGVFAVASAFGTPCALANFVPFSDRPFSGKDIFIPKLLRAAESGSLLSFEENVRGPLLHLYRGTRLAELGLEVVDNESDEIRMLAVEMMDDLAGERHLSSDDERRRDRFDRLFGHYTLGFASRPSAYFLRKHEPLLPAG